MRILVSNDDGVEAPGLHALARALGAIAEVWIVAPATEQSAQSHALTLQAPLRIRQHGERTYSVSGTPADAVYCALNHVCPPDITAVVSGINRGPNIADDVWYSGTVAAAREGALSGRTALSVSLPVRSGNADADAHWATAAALAVQLLPLLPSAGSEARTVFNLNVPDRPVESLGPLKVCPTGRQHYRPSVEVAHDPRGRPVHWIGGETSGFHDQPGTDGYWLEQGHPTLTPLQLDATDHRLLEQWRTRLGPS